MWWWRQRRRLKHLLRALVLGIEERVRQRDLVDLEGVMSVIYALECAVADLECGGVVVEFRINVEKHGHVHLQTESARARTMIMIMTSSFGLRRCSSKQKHWILLKYCAACSDDHD